MKWMGWKKEILLFLVMTGGAIAMIAGYYVAKYLGTAFGEIIMAGGPQ